MNVISIRSVTVHIVKTDERDYNEYTRYGPTSWTVRMGESDEQVYECAELEAAFQQLMRLPATCAY